MFNDRLTDTLLRAFDLLTFDPTVLDAATVECMPSKSLSQTPYSVEKYQKTQALSVQKIFALHFNHSFLQKHAR